MSFNPEETAELIINGRVYRDWKSVLVHRAFYEQVWWFRFTCTEGRPLAKDWAELRIRPGDKCTVYLAGQLAITGVVTTRQVAYTGHEHGIEIIGKSKTHGLDAAAMTETGEFKKQSFKEIIEKLAKPVTGLVTHGNVNHMFDRLNIAPGTSIWEQAESLARSANVMLGTDKQGNLVAVGKDGIGFAGSDRVTEGGLPNSILEGREIITMEFGGGPPVTVGQKSGTDEQSMSKVAQGFVKGLTGRDFGGPGIFMPKVVLSENPGNEQDMQDRSSHDRGMRTTEEWIVNITLQGWLRENGQLWEPGMHVTVWSPMLLLYNEALFCRMVESSQDSTSGTRTELELFKASEASHGHF